MQLPEYYAPRTPPMRHQGEALEQGWEREGFGYLLDMGLGKSRVTIDNFCLLFRAGKVDGMVVLAPKSVYLNWSREDAENPGELQKWLWDGIREDARICAWRSGKLKKDRLVHEWVLDTQSPGARILLVNVEALATADASDLVRRFLRAHRCMLVIDESIVIMNPKARRTKAALALAPLAPFRRILTGRVSTGSPTHLFSQFEFLGPHQMLLGHRSWYTFRARYCQLREVVVGGRSIKMEVGTQNLDELAGLVREHSYRRTKGQCLDLPPKQYLPKRPIELTDEQRKAYDELRRHAMTVVEGAEVTTQIVITQMMRMHQVLCGHIKTDEGQVIRLPTNRLAALDEIIDDTDERVVIWCGYRPDASRVVEHLRKKHDNEGIAEWHGGRTQAEREAGEADFQAGRRRFMVATQSSGARGRTWTAGTLVIYYSNTHDLELREQSEDRTHRIGTTGTVSYVDLVVPNSLDEKIIDSLRQKRIIVDRVMSDGLSAWI